MTKMLFVYTVHNYCFNTKTQHNVYQDKEIPDSKELLLNVTLCWCGFVFGY